MSTARFVDRHLAQVVLLELSAGVAELAERERLKSSS
jgi:hypothetical protein